MARVRYLEREDLAPEYQDMPRMKSNITRALANSPRGARHVAGTVIAVGRRVQFGLQGLRIHGHHPVLETIGLWPAG